MKLPVALLSALALTLVWVTSCSDSDPEAPVGGANSASGTLRLYCWPEYFEPEVLEDFTKATGIKVVYDTYDTTGDMEARLRSNPEEIDLMVIDSFNLKKLHQLSLLQPIDHSKVPGIANLDKRYLDTEYDPKNTFSIPYTWGTSLVAYRADHLTPVDHSWNLLWSEEAKGRVLMIDDTFDPLTVALLYLGKSPNTEDQADYEAATEALITQINELGAKYTDLETMKAQLLDGTASAALIFSGDAGVIAQENENIDYFLPKEGAPMWVDNFAISRDAPNADAAHAFINYLCQPEVAGKNSNSTRYANPCPASKAFMDEDLVSDKNIYPEPEVLDRCIPLAGLDAEREALINQSWLQVKRAWADARERIAQD